MTVLQAFNPNEGKTGFERHGPWISGVVWAVGTLGILAAAIFSLEANWEVISLVYGQITTAAGFIVGKNST